MNKNEPLPTPKAVEQVIPSRWIPRRWKILLSFFLGLLSIFLMFFLGEVWGEHAMFPGMAAYFLISQYFLSRANPQAVRKDWPLIVALNLPLLVSDIICLIVEPNTNTGAKLSALCMAILAVTCSYAGAGLAAKTAH
jgi:peptidoglycan/LPS O-acetylase OafA/YrhL